MPWRFAMRMTEGATPHSLCMWWCESKCVGVILSLASHNLRYNFRFQRQRLFSAYAEYLSVWMPATTGVTKPGTIRDIIGQGLTFREVQVQADSSLQIVLTHQLTGLFKRRNVGHYGCAGDQAFLEGS